MSSFVHEHINQLNRSLSASFVQQAQTQEVVAATAANDELEWFLTTASQSIDLSSGSELPDWHAVQSQLEAYLDRTDNDVSTESLAWLFVAKSTVAVYGILLDTLLNSTLPLSESIRYWNSIYGSRLHEAYYALQTAPIRAVRLVSNTIRSMQTTQLGLRALLQSPEHVLASLFPHRKIRHLLFSSIHKRPLLARMIHEEVGHKKKMLSAFRTQQATRLGLLMKLSPRFDRVEDETLQCIRLMQRVLDPLVEQQQQSSDACVIPEFHLDETLDEFVNGIKVRQEEQQHKDPRAAAQELVALIGRLVACRDTIFAAVHDTYGPPSALTRYWIPAVVVYVSANAAARVVFERQEAIRAWFRELGETARDFAVHWIWEPMLKVWETIRLRDQRLSVLSKEGLRSDLDSLERMVVQFARDHYGYGLDVDELLQKVREGDLSVVLRAYENEIKHPLRNAIAGDLIQTLLIQVQKTKVDVDLAMAALDKLLKSNELNFAFLAVAPSMLLTWASFSWLKSLYERRTGRQVGKMGQPIRETMRRVERLFDLAPLDGGQQQGRLLDCERQGALLCEVHLLRLYALQFLPKRNSIRDLFIEDLRDLENPNLSVTQKLHTIARMYRTWDFLHVAPRR